MNRMFASAAALLLAATAVPAFADAGPAMDGPPPPPPGMMGPGGHGGPGGRGGDHMRGPGEWGGMGGVLSGLTPEGRKTLADAMRETRRPENDSLDTARDKVLQILEADRLDVAALRRAMGEEHRLGEAQQQRRQEAMLGAFQKLSPRDRQAFATAMRSEHFKMEQRRKDMDTRMSKMRERWAKRGGQPGGPDMPPPPPPAK